MNYPPQTDRSILGLPRQVWGGISMVAGVACLAGNHSIVRIVADEVGAFETSALRFIWALPLMLPWILKGKGEVLRTKRHGLHFVSALLTAMTTALLFLGLAHLPVALATTLNFTAPLFTTIMAVVLLKERVELARWAATVVGFMGVLVVLRPGFVVFDPATLLPIASAAGVTLWYFTLKRLGRTESTATITVYQTVWVSLLLFLLALPNWQTPSFTALWLSISMAAMGTAAIFLMARAFELADASLIAPFDYARLPFVALFGYLLFDQIPDRYTVLGAAIIIGSAFYIARREIRTKPSMVDSDGSKTG
ncbi:MAG: DMT family transporter [Alphaproteobacteria bacterium]|jgi:drug/metabolite transporter (DMT)-like permease|nr:DMT family transporter [Alphaproteobacteria bacterium]